MSVLQYGLSIQCHFLTKALQTAIDVCVLMAHFLKHTACLHLNKAVIACVI